MSKEEFFISSNYGYQSQYSQCGGRCQDVMQGGAEAARCILKRVPEFASCQNVLMGSGLPARFGHFRLLAIILWTGNLLQKRAALFKMLTVNYLIVMLLYERNEFYLIRSLHLVACNSTDYDRSMAFLMWPVHEISSSCSLCIYFVAISLTWSASQHLLSSQQTCSITRLLQFSTGNTTEILQSCYC